MNRLALDGTVVFTHNTNSSPETFGKTAVSIDYSAGDTIDFAFLVNGNTNTASPDVANGSNGDNSVANQPNFFVVYLSSDLTLGADSMFNGTTLKAGLYVALDDAGGGDDDNHDDMVFRISAVPEPMTLVLFGGGLAVIAARRKKRRGEISA